MLCCDHEAVQAVLHRTPRLFALACELVLSSLVELFSVPCEVSIAQALGLCNMAEGIPSSFLLRPGRSSGILAVT